MTKVLNKCHFSLASTQLVLSLGYHNHLKATVRNHTVYFPALSCTNFMNWSPHFLYFNLVIIKPIVRLNEIMFERQLTQCLAYGKCSVNDSSYNDGDDEEQEGISKNCGDDISSSILSLHQKKNTKKQTCHLPSRTIRNRKAWLCYFLEVEKLLESPETILKHNCLNLLVPKIIWDIY